MLFSKLVFPVRVLSRRSKLERSCGWTRAALEAHQSRAVERLRRIAVARSPFYRRFHQGLEQSPIGRLPILTKAMLMERFDDVVTDRAITLAALDAYLKDGARPELFGGRYVVLATSGSSGRRGIFVFDEAEWAAACANITRPMGWAGVEHSLLRPKRMAVVASTTASHYSSRVGASLSSPFLPSLRIDAAQPLGDIVAQLNEWRPEVLAVYPSLLRQLADEQIAGRLAIALQSIGTSAEVLTDETRRRADDAWHIPVYDTYGATEYAPIAAQCPAGRRHLVEDAALIEVVDRDGQPVPDGADGDRVLITVFDRVTQPLIRYEISDMVRPVAGACECGRPFRLIERVEGRVEEILEFAAPGGGTVRVLPKIFHNIFDTVPAGGWQIILAGDGLHVRLVGLKDPAALVGLERSLRERLGAAGAVVPPLHLEEVSVLERGATGKAPLVARRP